MKSVLRQYDTALLSFDLRSGEPAGFACMNFRAMTDRQRKQLRKLIDFRFTRDSNYNLPAWRLKKLDAFVQHSAALTR